MGGDYYDLQFEDFGTLHVFNEDTLMPGAVGPFHPHWDNEVVTYIAGREFRHADETVIPIAIAKFEYVIP